MVDASSVGADQVDKRNVIVLLALDSLPVSPAETAVGCEVAYRVLKVLAGVRTSSVRCSRNGDDFVVELVRDSVNYLEVFHLQETTDVL